MNIKHDNQQSHLLDLVMERIGAKNDAALCRLLEVQAPVISKLRSQTLTLGPTLIIRIHELADMPVREIKALVGQKSLNSQRLVSQ